MFTEKSYRGETDTWLTPPWVYRPLGSFDMDPCGHPKSPTAPRKIIFPEEDGLKVPWEGRIWLNPPYGPQTGIFLNRLAAHGRGTALVLARTDTRWLQNHLRIAKCILFLHGRIKFLTPELKEVGSPVVPSLLLAYGEEDARLLYESSLKGWRVKQF
jgi:DNA N-6-adenine-methyltransferase (Dam)